MAYSHGTNWTSDKIIEEVLKVKNALNIDRLPTKSECILVTNSSSLSNAVDRYFGWYNLATILNLPLKKCETTTGKFAESMAENLLNHRGFQVKRMQQNYPFDLLINDCARIDVKASHLYCGEKGDYFTFGLGKKYHCCDFFMLIELNDINEAIRVMIVPALSVMGISQISIGITNSIYFKYIDRYDCIKNFIDFNSNNGFGV